MYLIVSLQANIRNTFFDQKSLRHPEVGANGSNREAIHDGGLWKFLTVRQTYPLGNQS